MATEAFAGLARTEGAAFGMPGLRVVEIPHPLAGARPEDIRRFADQAVSGILELFARR